METKEEKSLLLQDICARVPYGIKFKANNEEYIREIHYIKDEDVYIREYRNLSYWICTIKPYLRPMSSMTEEEKIESLEFAWEDDYGRLASYEENIPKYIDWLNKKMFDYRGLIEKGLALEAPKDMYKTKEK